MRVCNAMGSTPCDDRPSTPCVGLRTTRVGEPDAGHLHVRFDEGERLSPRSLLDRDIVSALSAIFASDDKVIYVSLLRDDPE